MTEKSNRKLGTFLGVYTPTVLTILGAIMFLVTFFLFSIQMPFHYFIFKISNSSRKKSTRSSFITYHKTALLLGIISIIGFVIGLGLNIYAHDIGFGTYRIFSTIISLGLSTYITFKVFRTTRLIT